ncbi:MAG: FAD-dependent oxidoreductase [Lachnospiraceae bacterium]
MEQIYDLVIIGSGSAGMAAGIYAGRAKMKTLILEKQNPGGQVANTAEVVNYPGIRRTSGPGLVEEMGRHVRDFNVQTQVGEITGLSLTPEIKEIQTTSGTVKARSVILATGAQPRKIGFEGEELFTGRGVGYCATCDGEFFTGLDLFVLGGGYAAAEEAVYLTRFAKSVTVVIRKDCFSCAKTVADKTISHPKIKVMYNTQLVRLEGDVFPQKAVFKNTQTQEESIYETKEGDAGFGVFVFAGYQPATELFKDQVTLDEGGYIPTDDQMRTNIPGVYAAGDLRPKLLRQIVTAVADGAIAATSAEKYVTAQKERLGIPMFEEEPDQSQLEQPVQEAPSPAAAAPSAAKGRFLDAAIKNQLKEIFKNLTKDVYIRAVLKDGQDKSMELHAMLQDVEELSPLLHLEILHDAAADIPDAAGAPFLWLLDEQKHDVGVRFSGIPGGHEMNSFVLALLHVGSTDKISEEQKERIERLPETKVQVAVSLSCHFCPDVVAAVHSIAIASGGRLQGEMIDVGLFPDIKNRFKIMSVPAMIINDGTQVVFGSKSMDEIIGSLEPASAE